MPGLQKKGGFAQPAEVVGFAGEFASVVVQAVLLGAGVVGVGVAVGLKGGGYGLGCAGYGIHGQPLEHGRGNVVHHGAGASVWGSAGWR